MEEKQNNLNHLNQQSINRRILGDQRIIQNSFDYQQHSDNYRQISQRKRQNNTDDKKENKQRIFAPFAPYMIPKFLVQYNQNTKAKNYSPNRLIQKDNAKALSFPSNETSRIKQINPLQDTYRIKEEYIITPRKNDLSFEASSPNRSKRDQLLQNLSIVATPRSAKDRSKSAITHSRSSNSKHSCYICNIPESYDFTESLVIYLPCQKLFSSPIITLVNPQKISLTHLFKGKIQRDINTQQALPKESYKFKQIMTKSIQIDDFVERNLKNIDDAQFILMFAGVKGSGKKNLFKRSIKIALTLFLEDLQNLEQIYSQVSFKISCQNIPTKQQNYQDFQAINYAQQIQNPSDSFQLNQLKDKINQINYEISVHLDRKNSSIYKTVFFILDLIVVQQNITYTKTVVIGKHNQIKVNKFSNDSIFAPLLKLIKPSAKYRKYLVFTFNPTANNYQITQDTLKMATQYKMM